MINKVHNYIRVLSRNGEAFKDFSFRFNKRHTKDWSEARRAISRHSDLRANALLIDPGNIEKLDPNYKNTGTKAVSLIEDVLNNPSKNLSENDSLRLLAAKYVIETLYQKQKVPSRRDVAKILRSKNIPE